MHFKELVEANAALSACAKKGLGAVSKGNKQKIKFKNPKSISCSVDIDACLKRICPDQSRWDYGFGVDAKSIFLEVHPATTGEVRVVLKKLAWLKSWMKENCPGFDRTEKSYYWLASGKVAVLANSPQRRLLAGSGLVGPVGSMINEF
jgi:hypothetical protein